MSSSVQKFLVAGEAAKDREQQQSEELADQAEQRFFERVEVLKGCIHENDEWLFDWMTETTWGDARYKCDDPYARQRQWGMALAAVATAKTTGEAIKAARQMQAVIEQAAAWRAEEISRSA